MGPRVRRCGKEPNRGWHFLQGQQRLRGVRFRWLVVLQRTRIKRIRKYDPYLPSFLYFSPSPSFFLSLSPLFFPFFSAPSPSSFSYLAINGLERKIARRRLDHDKSLPTVRRIATGGERRGSCVVRGDEITRLPLLDGVP
jgi:hypothetical protein